MILLRATLVTIAALTCAVAATCLGAALLGCAGRVESSPPTDTCARYETDNCMAECEDAGGTECARACAATECP
jgi:hypothetical protein